MKEYKFRAMDFYELLEEQEYRCPLTGRELTPGNTTAEHIVPLRQRGEHCRANIYLVVKTVAKIKRYVAEEELVQLAADIIRTKGAHYGLAIRKKR